MLTEAFRSSDEYDEQAHQLYNESRYDDALELLAEGLTHYPHAVELHIGAGYAQLAREEYAWARRAFDTALTLEPDHEDAMAGLGETLLALGRPLEATSLYARILELGFDDDHELMIQIGRALFRAGYFAEARRYFERGWVHHPASAELAASLGYTAHRLGFDADAFYWLRRALELEPSYSEPRIYLANILYDRGENAAAMLHFSKTRPDDHFDDLGIWRIIDLLRSEAPGAERERTAAPWIARLGELSDDVTADEMLLAELENRSSDGTALDPQQLELFATLMREPHEMLKRPGMDTGTHVIETLGGLTLRGSWDDLLLQLQAVEGAWAADTLPEFMRTFALRGHAETGVSIPLNSAEAFMRGAAEAGVIRIVS